MRTIFCVPRTVAFRRYCYTLNSFALNNKYGIADGIVGFGSMRENAEKRRGRTKEEKRRGRPEDKRREEGGMCLQHRA